MIILVIHLSGTSLLTKIMSIFQNNCTNTTTNLYCVICPYKPFNLFYASKKLYDVGSIIIDIFKNNYNRG